MYTFQFRTIAMEHEKRREHYATNRYG